MFKNTDKLIARTYSVSYKQKNKIPFKNIKSCAQQSDILDLVRKRLQLQDKVPNQVLKVEAIERGENILNLIKSGYLKVIWIQINHQKAQIHIVNKNAKIKTCVQRLQFITPKQRKSDSEITVVIPQDNEEVVSWDVPYGESVKQILTRCFNRKNSVPKYEEYYVGTLKSGYILDYYKNRQKIWKIQIFMKEDAQKFIQRQQKQSFKLIALKKNQLIALNQSNARELEKW